MSGLEHPAIARLCAFADRMRSGQFVGKVDLHVAVLEAVDALRAPPPPPPCPHVRRCDCLGGCKYGLSMGVGDG